MYRSKPLLVALGALVVHAELFGYAISTHAASLTAKGVGSSKDISYPSTQSDLAWPNAFLISQAGDFTSFMETGTLRSEDRFRRTAPNDPMITINTVNPGWQFFAFRSGNVSLWIPPGALTQESVVLNTPAGSIPAQMLVADNKDGRYIAAYTSNLSSSQNNAQLLYDAVKQRVAANNNLAIKSEQDVSLGKFSGREVRLENTDQIVVLRMYLINGQFYVMGVQSLRPNINDRAVRGFLNSLQILS